MRTTPAPSIAAARLSARHSPSKSRSRRTVRFARAASRAWRLDRLEPRPTRPHVRASSSSWSSSTHSSASTQTPSPRQPFACPILSTSRPMRSMAALPCLQRPRQSDDARAVRDLQTSRGQLIRRRRLHRWAQTESSGPGADRARPLRPRGPRRRRWIRPRRYRGDRRVVQHLMPVRSPARLRRAQVHRHQRALHPTARRASQHARRKQRQRAVRGRTRGRHALRT